MELTATDKYMYSNMLIGGFTISYENETSESAEDNLPYPPDSTSVISQLVIWAIIDIFLMFFILFGNVLTICALKFSRKLSAFISNQFILNLAVSDLFVGLTLPYHLAFYMDTTLGSHKSTCLLRFILIAMACCASIYNLIAIAVDRYIAIVYPLHYNRYITRTAAICLITFGWLVALTLATVPIYWNKYENNKKCELHEILPDKYITMVMTPVFATVWITMLVVYVRIWREASDHAKRIRTSNSAGPGVPNRDWKSVQVVLLVLGCFSICWLPYLTVACAQATDILNSEDDATLIYKISFSLAIANSGINPLIYAWKNSGFRKAFIHLLHCRSPDSTEYDPSIRHTFAQNEKRLRNERSKFSARNSTGGSLDNISTKINQTELNEKKKRNICIDETSNNTSSQSVHTEMSVVRIAIDINNCNNVCCVEKKW